MGDGITTAQENFKGTLPLRGEPPDRSRGKTVPVESGTSNAFGLFDMHGNVREWCLDVFVRAYYWRDEASAANPACAWGSNDRAVRGGSWQSRAVECRAAGRTGEWAPHNSEEIGFRPVFQLR